MTTGTSEIGGSRDMSGVWDAAETDADAGIHDARRALEDARARGEVDDEIAALLAALAAGTLDADSIMRMCRRRCDTLDASIMETMGRLEDSNARASEIGEEMAELRNLQEWLSSHATTTSSGWSNDPLVGEEYALTVENMRAWLRASGTDPDTVDLEATLVAEGMDPGTAAMIVRGTVDRGALEVALLGEGVALAGSPTSAITDEEIRELGLRGALEAHGVDPEAAARIAERVCTIPQASLRVYLDLNGHSDLRTPQDLQNRISALGEELTDCNSGNELEMIRLQSLMQARTSVIQMTTNMLKALDEAADSTVGNLR